MSLIKRVSVAASILGLALLAALLPATGTAEAQTSGYDLAVSAANFAANSPPGPGEEFQMQVSVQNIGDVAASGVVVSVDIPAYTVASPRTLQHWQCNPAAGGTETTCVLTIPEDVVPGPTYVMNLFLIVDDVLPPGVTETVLYVGCGPTLPMPCSTELGVSAKNATQPDLNPANNHTSLVVPLAAPQSCQPGTFSSSGSAPCVPSPPGFFVAVEGAAQATPCAVGTFQPASGAVSCLAAPVGTYVDFAGATAATPCPAGTSTIGVGSADASDCLVDFDGDGLPDVVDADDDNDGVADEADRCARTDLAGDTAPPDFRSKNRIWSDAVGNFVGAGVTVVETGGCSASQVIAAAGLGRGHAKFGLSSSALDDWIASVG